MDTPPAAPPLPLFYRRIEVLARGRHAGLRLAAAPDYGFARHANAIPLSFTEIVLASRHYPIVFNTEGQSGVLAVVGISRDANLFVEDDGQWRRGTYVPAYVRAYPFIFILDPDGSTLHLGFDAEAETLSEDRGDPLLGDGQPTERLTQALNFAKVYRDDRQRATAFCDELQRAGLLEDNQAAITFGDGGRTRLDGFKVVERTRFAASSDAVFLDWRRRGLLDPVYAHLASSTGWTTIIDLADQRRAAAK